MMFTGLLTILLTIIPIHSSILGYSTPLPPESPVGYLLHVTDIHMDLDYHPGSPTRCVLGSTGLGCCRQYDIPLAGHQPASRWGEKTCDAPLLLVNETFRWISKHLPHTPSQGLDAILYGGDSVGHHDISQGYQRNIRTANQVTSLLHHYFASTPVLPNQGNHDTYPIDQVLPGVGAHFRGHLAENWQAGIGAEAGRMFQQHGYYSYPLNRQVLVVSMASILYDSHNLFRTVPNNQDPQVVWLNQTIHQARAEGRHILVLGHIFPEAGEATTPFTTWLSGVLQNNTDVIYSSVFGHSHNDQWVVIPPNQATGLPPAAAVVTPSLMPDARNPSFRLYQYQRSTGKIMDYQQYYVDLTATQATDQLQVRLEYQFQTEYHQPDLSGTSLWHLSQQMQSDLNLAGKYCQHYWGTGNTTGGCDPTTLQHLLTSQIVTGNE